MTYHHHTIGTIGEDLAARFLMKRGLRVIARNYRKKWGEIDIVAQDGDLLRFVEVKTISHETPQKKYGTGNSVTHVTSYKPEDKVDARKVDRLRRVIQSYLSEHRVSPETSWCFDIVAITLNTTTKEAKVRFLEKMVI